MKKALAITPTDDNKRYINAIGGLLGKMLPSGWEKARLYIEKNNNISEWKGFYSLQGAEKTAFILNKDIISNLEKLRSDTKYTCPMSSITFHRNGAYNMEYDHTVIERLSTDDIQGKIETLQALDFKNISVDDIKKDVSALASGYMLNSPIIPAGEKFYRGVLCEEKPHKVSQLNSPPKEKVDKLHRAGKPNQPLFYCSSVREAVFYELGIHAGDTLVVSKWETASSLSVNNVGYHPDIIKKLGSDRTMPAWYNNELPKGMERDNLLVQRFFADEFTKIVPSGQEHKYKFSVAIAEQHFQHDMFDGLLYPAIAMRGNADNLAIKPMAVDEKLVLKKVEYIQVTDDSNGSYKITLLDFANSFTEDGQIEWKGRLPHWVLRNKGDQLTVAVENGKWVARNLKGEIVEPD